MKYVAVEENNKGKWVIWGLGSSKEEARKDATTFIKTYNLNHSEDQAKIESIEVVESSMELYEAILSSKFPLNVSVKTVTIRRAELCK
jgi:hypothetical protein